MNRQVQRRHPKRKPNVQAERKRRTIFASTMILLVMLMGVLFGFLTASINTKPDLNNDLKPPVSSQIYDINGNEIANLHATENRKLVKLAQMPKDLQNAFVAVEDNRFYEHWGIDLKGILRALWANISGGEIAEGGSTLTQQLAKNAYLTQERTLTRKVQEIFLALQLERQYTKDEIMEMYLNQIYFGQGAYGVQAAAQTYFGKNSEDLNLNECAMLAGIPKSPNYYSPFNNKEAANTRKAVVLDQMQKYGYINANTAANVKKEPLALIEAPNVLANQEAAYFIEYVTQLMIDKYGADAVYKDGLRIYTTLDLDMQRQAEASMKALPTYGADGNGIEQPQGALVAIDPHNGYIKAMVGGRGTDKFNRASMAVRQTGSAFKPFVFAAALESDFSADTVVNDSPIKIGSWEPQNYDRRFRGQVTLREVARNSLNVPTVKIAQKVGIEKAIDLAKKMGISSFVLNGPQNDINLSTALGGLTKGITPLELTSAYGTFANKGVHVTPVAIIKVLDRNGKVLEQSVTKQEKAISESTAGQLTSLLQTVVQSGTGTGANIGRPAAGKTGTTDEHFDAWFVGYTPDLVTGVWIGTDDNQSLHGMTGGNLPAEIWKNFMSQAVASVPVKDFDGYKASGGSVSSVEDDSSSVKRSFSRKKEPSEPEAPSRQASSEKTNNVVENDNNQSAETSIPEAPSEAPPPANSSAPTPGAGISKGRY